MTKKFQKKLQKFCTIKYLYYICKNNQNNFSRRKQIMSTRCSILLRVKPEDQGKVYKQSAEFSRRVNGVKDQSNIGEFKITGPYIGIYCHHDGYLSHMGKTLTELFNKYEDVLDLVAGGDTSYIEKNGVGYYAGERGERWKNDNGNNRLIRCLNEIEPVSGDAEYIYVFDYETSKWKYSRVPWRPDSRVVWESIDELSDVEEALAER